MMIQTKIRQTKNKHPFYYKLYSYRSMASSISKWSLSFTQLKRHDDFLRKTVFLKWPFFLGWKWIRYCLIICLLSTHFARSMIHGSGNLYDELAEFRLGKKLGKINLGGRHIFDSRRIDKSVDTHYYPKLRNRFSTAYTAEVYWSTSNAAKKICRLRNACIRTDGSLVLHSSLRKHEEEVRQCHSHNLFFFSVSEYPPKSIAYSDMILIGSWPARFHIPHFLTDVLSAIYSIELIWPISKHLKVAYSCFWPFNGNCSALRRESTERDLENLKTALLVENRILGMRTEDWVPQFASLMLHNPKLISVQSLFESDSSEKMHCFNTIVAYDPGKYNLESDWFDDKNRFFNENRLKRNRTGLASRGAISQNDAGSHTEMKQSKKRCNAKILILNRSVSQKRSLLHADEIKNRVQERLRESSDMKISANIIVKYFEDLKFEEQVRNMQGADIVIGVHGAGLANLVFAKQGTFFLEIFPFLYYAGPFKTIANTMGVNYHSYIAYPDFLTFNNCIHDVSRKNKLPNLIVTAKKLWDEALKNNRTFTKKMDFSLTNHPMAAYLRFCARQQQLRVQIDAFIGVTIEMTKKFCNF